MEPYQERVITEKAELDERLERLYRFFPSDAFSALDDAEQMRLKRQFIHMTEYSQVLSERIEAFAR